MATTAVTLTEPATLFAIHLNVPASCLTALEMNKLPLDRSVT